MSAAHEVVGPGEAARLMIWCGVCQDAIRNDADLALTLFEILSMTSGRGSRIPADFDAVRFYYAEIVAGRSPEYVNA